MLTYLYRRAMWIISGRIIRAALRLIAAAVGVVITIILS